MILTVRFLKLPSLPKEGVSQVNQLFLQFLHCYYEKDLFGLATLSFFWIADLNVQEGLFISVQAGKTYDNGILNF